MTGVTYIQRVALKGRRGTGCRLHHRQQGRAPDREVPGRLHFLEGRVNHAHAIPCPAGLPPGGGGFDYDAPTIQPRPRRLHNVPQIPGDFDYEAALPPAQQATGKPCTAFMNRKVRGCWAWRCASCASARWPRTSCTMPASISGRVPPATTRAGARGWIYSVVRNLALNAVRDGSRHVDVDDTTTQALEADMSVQAHHEVEEAFELNASLGRLQHCLEGAGPGAPCSCVLHAYVDGCSHGEIGRAPGRPAGHRGRRGYGAAWYRCGRYGMTDVRNTPLTPLPENPERAGWRVRAGHPARCRTQGRAATPAR